MECSAMGSFRSLKEFRPGLDLGDDGLPVFADGVDREPVGD